jgi:hypothetical protein
MLLQPAACKIFVPAIASCRSQVLPQKRPPSSDDPQQAAGRHHVID